MEGAGMNDYLPKEVREGLEAARKRALRRKNRLRAVADDVSFPVLRLWDEGFALDSENAPQLRGMVDLYDGARHLYQCLVIASAEEAGEMRYEFKWHRAVSDTPPLDFARDESAPVALLPR